MKELGWQQEYLTNSSSRPPMKIRSYDQRTLHEEEEVPANFYFFNDKEALDLGLIRASRSRRSWDHSGRSRFPWPIASRGLS